jgi:two-component system LytT family response regulator
LKKIYQKTSLLPKTSKDPTQENVDFNQLNHQMSDLKSSKGSILKFSYKGYLKHQIKKNMESESLVLSTPLKINNRLKIIPNELIMLKANINYTYLYLSNGKKEIVSLNIGKIEKILQITGCFIRPNRHFLVNLNFVDDISVNWVEIDSQKFLISRRQWKSVFNRILTYNLQIADTKKSKLEVKKPL